MCCGRLSNQNRVNASGIRSDAFATLLIHESSRGGDLVIHAGRLRDGVCNYLDSGKIFAI